MTFRTPDLATARAQLSGTGFLVLPGLVPPELCARLAPEVDRWVDEGLRARSIAAMADEEGRVLPPVLELELAAHGELVVLPNLLDLLEGLLGGPVVFHHLHSDRHGAGTPDKAWHHDHEPNDRDDSSLAMVHALHYLGGLDGTVGDLVVLPGSHVDPPAKDARAHLRATEIPGEVVLDDLPPGSTVLINSALAHARRAKPGGAGRTRYFVDASYCRTGARWRPVKPYWRHVLARAREMRLGGDRWPDLFDDRHFTEYTPG